MLKKDKMVLIQEIYNDSTLQERVSEAFDKITAGEIIKKGDQAAIKVNIGGGIDYVPTSFADPVICEAIINKLRKMGAHRFICEANMWAREMPIT
ncbi:MAG: hypothetical protein ACTSWE_05205 [Promethearchaeota archaeon]